LLLHRPGNPPPLPPPSQTHTTHPSCRMVARESAQSTVGMRIGAYKAKKAAGTAGTAPAGGRPHLLLAHGRSSPLVHLDTSHACGALYGCVAAEAGVPLHASKAPAAAVVDDDTKAQADTA